MKALQELMAMDGRVALITGGAGHLGRAIAQALAELKATVVITDLDPAACEARAAEISEMGGGAADWLDADLLDERATRDLARRTLKRYGRLDVLVHNAAFVGTTPVPGWAEPLEKQTVEAWDAAMRVNLTAAFILVQETASALSASGHGSIILVSSIYGLSGPDMKLYAATPLQNPAAYGASKGGLLQLMHYFASLLAPKVRVNAFTPGGLRRDQPKIFRDRYEARTPLGRMAREEDLKGAAAFLASDLSNYVTGHNLVVDGGWTAW